jgi:hypothetical protein
LGVWTVTVESGWRIRSWNVVSARARWLAISGSTTSWRRKRPRFA